MRGGRIAAGQYRRAEMGDALEAFAGAAGKNFAAPDGAVVAVARAVETDADNSFVPCSALRQDGSDVRAVMLHSAFFYRGKFRSMDRRNILGMRIVHEQ